MLYDEAFTVFTVQEIFRFAFLVNERICTILQRRYFPLHFTPAASPPRRACAAFPEIRFV